MSRTTRKHSRSQYSFEEYYSVSKRYQEREDCYEEFSRLSRDSSETRVDGRWPKAGTGKFWKNRESRRIRRAWKHHLHDFENNPTPTRRHVNSDFYMWW